MSKNTVLSLALCCVLVRGWPIPARDLASTSLLAASKLSANTTANLTTALEADSAPASPVDLANATETAVFYEIMLDRGQSAQLAGLQSG